MNAQEAKVKLMNNITQEDQEFETELKEAIRRGMNIFTINLTDTTAEKARNRGFEVKCAPIQDEELLSMQQMGYFKDIKTYIVSF